MCLAVPGEIVQLHDRHGLRFGRVRFGGITRDVCLEYQPDAAVGEFVLVHVGFAIARIDRDEAARQWELLRELEPDADELAEDAPADAASDRGDAERQLAFEGAGFDGERTATSRPIAVEVERIDDECTATSPPPAFIDGIDAAEDP